VTELSKQFDFRAVEGKWIKHWKDNNLFHANADSKKPPYIITIPPPNITGILHMGHALNNTLQDIIIRYKRMNGFETCWMPGTDHAGIATQNVVEKKLAEEGKSRHDVGRAKFLEEVWKWKELHGSTIIKQLECLGASCDWPRTRFTMDDDYSNAVKTVFIKLYEKNLIYKGERIINWCPRCHTALSDEEAEHEEVQGTLTHIKYPIKNSNEFITVATTRPETMLGDTAVAVNPKDKRYKKYIGQMVILPLMNREIPIISDDFVDQSFGTGAVKVTPAHDPNDFGMGQRHNLEFINVMHEDGRINDKGGEFSGLDRFKARSKIVESLKKSDLIVKVEEHAHSVGHCYRCHTMVEPYLSMQWFVKMEPLAKPAIKAVTSGKIKIHPKRWEKVYMNWMENIRDWCISRQIWWGHRIPVWYCTNDDHSKPQCKEPLVTYDDPKECPHCGSKNLKQDTDVLDTWFSSWLWPFATFGWPEENDDIKFFYPGHALFTAPEIIFFWVARMIMAGYEFMGDLPFTDVYLHGTVRDEKGRKMSKSLGNALDPLEIIEEYGADALRYSLIINSGQDLFISKDKFEIGRNFANKMWNASRLILMNVKSIDPSFKLSMVKDGKDFNLASKWLVSKFYTTLGKVSTAIEQYRYSEAESLIYDFFWGNFCDWYLEIIKDQWSDASTQNTAYKILEESLKMIHPFMPFVTEEIWSQCQESNTSMCVQPWPKYHKKLIDRPSEISMQTVIDIVTQLRIVRAQWNIKPNEKIQCHLWSSSKEDVSLLNNNEGIIKSLARVGTLNISTKAVQKENSAAILVGKIKGSIPLGNVIDIDKERARMLSAIDEQKKITKGLTGRLKNKDFVKKAPKDVIEKEKDRLIFINIKIEELQKVVDCLN